MQKTFTIIAVVIIVIAGAYFLTNDSTPANNTDSELARIENDAPVEAEDTTELTSDDESAEAVAQAIPYTASVSYLTPSRASHDMAITLVVDDSGIITDTSIIYDNGDGFSNGHQERFDTGYRSLVIGQSLESINLATVAGASLTTQAFNEAVVKIRAERT